MTREIYDNIDIVLQNQSDNIKDLLAQLSIDIEKNVIDNKSKFKSNKSYSISKYYLAKNVYNFFKRNISDLYPFIDNKDHIYELTIFLDITFGKEYYPFSFSKIFISAIPFNDIIKYLAFVKRNNKESYTNLKNGIFSDAIYHLSNEEIIAFKKEIKASDIFIIEKAKISVIPRLLNIIDWSDKKVVNKLTEKIIKIKTPENLHKIFFMYMNNCDSSFKENQFINTMWKVKPMHAYIGTFQSEFLNRLLWKKDHNNIVKFVSIIRRAENEQMINDVENRLFRMQSNIDMEKLVDLLVELKYKPRDMIIKFYEAKMKDYVIYVAKRFPESAVIALLL